MGMNDYSRTVKSAAGKGSAIQGISRLGKRYLELLRGGDKNLGRGCRHSFDLLMRDAKASLAADADKGPLAHVLKRIALRPYMQLYKVPADAKSLRMGMSGETMRNALRKSYASDWAEEANKVLAARLGTAGVLGGSAYGGVKAMSSGKDNVKRSEQTMSNSNSVKAAEYAVREAVDEMRKRAAYEAGVNDAFALIEKVAQETETSAVGNSNLEGLGKWTSVIGTTAGGATLGKLLKSVAKTKRGAGTGGAIGLGLGLLANMGGKLTAAVTKARTGSAQASHDRKMRWADLLVPGKAVFDSAKRKEREVIHQWH